LPRNHIKYWFLTVGALAIGFLVFATFVQNWIKEDTSKRLIQSAENLTSIQSQSLESELKKFEILPSLLSENPVVLSALGMQGGQSGQELNTKLAELVEDTGATYVYVIDANGITLASSNYASEESFVGRSYEFRPYFQDALEYGSGRYFAEGERTGKAGLFLAERIGEKGSANGVIVVKVEFGDLSENWTETNAKTIVVNRDGIVLFSSDPTLDFTALRPIASEVARKIKNSKQFGSADLKSAPFSIVNSNEARDRSGKKMHLSERTLPITGWKLHRLEYFEPALAAANARVQLIWLLSGGALTAILALAWRRQKRAHNQSMYLQRLEKDVTARTRELSESKILLEEEIEEKERVYTRYRAAREELAQANRLGSIGAITASVAHEVNQPLAAIKAFAENSIEFLRRGNSASASENLDAIVSLSGRLGEITSELRSYSRRGSGAITNVSVSRVIDGVNLLMGDRLRQAGIKVDLPPNIDPELRVTAGAVRLEQVLVNILQNALDAVANSEAPEVKMTIDARDQIVVILIEDNGPGVDEKNAGNIFDPFTSHKKDGLGIGLSIAQDIMKEFGGSLKLVTAQNLKGAAFEIQLLRA